MRISVVGCGYLGAVHAAAMASLGHDVVGVDIDPTRIATLTRGSAPFFEPGLPELLAAGIESGRLTFSTDMAAVSTARVHFLAIGTPQTESGAANMSYLFAAVADLIPWLSAGDLVVGKSTVPVGIAQELAVPIESVGARLVWNPEFLREGRAVKDTLGPDRMIYGVRPGDEDSVAVLDTVYAELLAEGCPRLVTNYATAELVKVAANAFLATKISFINAMAEIAEVAGADVTQLADAIGRDARIGRSFLNAGLGFGGGCLPKDIRGFVARAEELGVGESLGFLREVDAINLRRRDRVIELARTELGGSIDGARVAALGLAFKPDSDDVRDSPALDVAKRLLGEGAEVVATDPQAIGNSRRLVPGLDYRESALDCAIGADIVLVLTEWREFVELDPREFGALVSTRTIIDARNCLDRDRWTIAGWRVLAPGRPEASAIPELAI